MPFSTNNTKASKGAFFESELDSAHEFSMTNQAFNTLPKWLDHIMRNDKQIINALTRKSKYTPASPHKRALIELIKNPKKAQKKAEHYIQVRLFYWLETNYPDVYELTKAVPNGGKRSIKTAIDLNAEGVKSGSPDIDIEIARGAYHGMKLEVKTETGTLQKNQKEKLKKLNDAGYYAVYGKGFDECQSLILKYIELGKFDNKTVII